MKVAFALVLLALFVFCAESRLAYRPTWAQRPPWHTPYPRDDSESDSEFIKSVWKKVAPIAKELGKNYLRSKGIPLQDEDEADFTIPSWVNWENAQKAIDLYNQFKRDDEDEDEADFRLPSWVNMENAQKAINIYNSLRRDQDDEADEESDAEFIKSVWKKVAPIAKELGKNYLRSKGIPLADAEFSFKKLVKKVAPVLKTVGTMYLRTQGVPLSDSDSQFFKDWMKKAGNWLKNPENLQKAVDIYRTVRSDEAEEESENPWLWGARAFAWVMKPKPAYDNVEESDAQFFKDWMKKAGRWLKEPENLQKVVDVYRTVRSDEAEEEADWGFPRCICNSPFNCPC